MKKDTDLTSDLPDMVTPIQGTTCLSAVLELWLTLSLFSSQLQTFQMNLRETTHPAGRLKHTYLLQETELKHTDHHFIISPHFGTLKRIKGTIQTILSQGA